MRVLRNLEKAADQYQLLLETNQQNLRTYKDEYSQDVTTLLEIVDNYIGSVAQEFEMWACLSVEVFNYDPSNMFKKIKKRIVMVLINYFLNSLSYKMFKAGYIKETLDKVNCRLEQFKYWG